MVKLFKWNRGHEIYLAEIDAEHRALFQIASEIHQAVLTGAGAERLKPMLDALMACAEGHFAHEERLMRAARYSAYAWHKRQHDGVRTRMQQFIGAMEQGEAEDPELLLEYLSDWIKGHMSLTDRMMGAYLRNHERGHAIAS
ncbi:MAG TPA: hemerythrin family protein [Bryobacteraceae bacterium]|nr:hemerythrin family protein [Bryobacteraceae bacterium]